MAYICLENECVFWSKTLQVSTWSENTNRKVVKQFNESEKQTMHAKSVLPI